MTTSTPTTQPRAYRTKEGDTLGAIAHQFGLSPYTLGRINQLKNLSQLQVGQVLFLHEEDALAVHIQVLDALRHPIPNYSFKFVQTDKNPVIGTTDKDGVYPMFLRDKPDATITIYVLNVHNRWELVGKTEGRPGRQIIAVQSPYVMVKGHLEKLPKDPNAGGQAQQPATQQQQQQQPPTPKPADGDPSKHNPNVKQKRKKGDNGEAVVSIDLDLPKGLMDYFALYTGQAISQSDWNDTAKSLSCEVAVLQAFAQVESGGDAFWQLNTGHGSAVVPTILYERHNFHRLTCANGPRMNTKHHKYHGIGVHGCHSPYDNRPDICWPEPFVRSKVKGHKTLGDKKPAMPDGKVELTDQYGDGAKNYLRLIQAYQLNADAALKATSWGKFQLLGENYQSNCGQPSLKEFMGFVA